MTFYHCSCCRLYRKWSDVYQMVSKWKEKWISFWINAQIQWLWSITTSEKLFLSHTTKYVLFHFCLWINVYSHIYMAALYDCILCNILHVIGWEGYWIDYRYELLINWYPNTIANPTHMAIIYCFLLLCPGYDAMDTV